MGVRVSAEEFSGNVLHTAESSDPVVVGDEADWDTGGTTPPPAPPTEEGVRDAGRWELAVIPGAPPDSLYADGDWLYIWVPG